MAHLPDTPAVSAGGQLCCLGTPYRHQPGDRPSTTQPAGAEFSEKSLVAEPAAAPAPDGLLQQETRDKIRQVFCRLPVKLRVAATLALIEERPHDEIADALGISVGAVKLRVFRAVRILHRQLEHLGVAPGETRR